MRGKNGPEFRGPARKAGWGGDGAAPEKTRAPIDVHVSAKRPLSPTADATVALARLRAHDLCSALPPLPPGELAELRADIATRGIFVPIEVNRDGVVIDGHARRSIATELGLSVVPIVSSRRQTSTSTSC